MFSKGAPADEAPVSARAGWQSWLQTWPVRDVVVPFVVTRIVLVIIGWLAMQALQGLPATPGAWEVKVDGQLGRIASHVSPHIYPLVNMWARWDSGWYHSVAKYGYQFTPGKQSSAAFFPLYPMAMRAAHLVIPGSSDLGWFVSGIIVANLSLLVALFYLVRLVRLDFGAGPARRVGVYLLVFPTTFFLSAVYSEATFLAVTVAAFYHARRGQWWIAGALGGLAALTRSPGILLCVPLLIEYMAQRDYQLRRIRFDVAALALVPLCLAGLFLYFQWRFGNAFATRDSQAAWGEGWGVLSWPWQPFVQMAQQKLVAKDLIDLTFALVLLALSVVAAIWLRASYGVYAVLSYWFVTAWGSLASVPRYALAVFPIFLVLALLGRNRIFHQAYLVSACALSAFFMMMFAVWRWVA
ncbi:MAG: hypothetical protein H0V56_08455 [Chthoniobacterales bacterium]|nr:hypothetical protein [Chthoniobacterales bacterium]